MLENLNKDELERLKELSEIENTEIKYEWDVRYQREILSSLLMDRMFLVQSIDLIKPEYFTETIHQLICKLLFTYFRQYKQLPTKVDLINEIKSFKKEDKKLYLYLGELDALINSYIPGLISRESCLSKITEFAKEQAFRAAVWESLDLLKKNYADKWIKMKENFNRAFTVERNFDSLGLDYFQTINDRYERMASESQSKEKFVIGFNQIEQELDGGLCRGEIGAFVGLPGVGKSVLLVQASVRNIVRGKKVLYISLEMNQDKVAKRFDAQLSLVPIGDLMKRKDEVISILEDHNEKNIDKRRLVIKQFPAGSANVDTIRAFYLHLGMYGFKPDMLVVDYVGEMRDYEGIPTYESRQRMVRDLRGFGVEENHCTLTAMQPNRKGREQQDEDFIDDDALGDSFGQVRPLDALWSINQTAADKKCNLGKLFVIKHRDGRSRFPVYYKQNPETLYMQEIEEKTYYTERNKGLAHATENEKFNKPFKPNQ